MKISKILTGFIFLATSTWGAVAGAQTIPYSFSHHGLLWDGDKLANGSFNITATLYDGEENVIATETKESMPIFDGFYSITLNNISPDKILAAGGQLKLGIKVGNNDEMRPLLDVSAVPYAMASGHADSADDVKCDGCVGLEQLNPTIQSQIQGTAGIYPARAHGTFAFNYFRESGKTTNTIEIYSGENFTVDFDADNYGIYFIKFKKPLPDDKYTVLAEVKLDTVNKDASIDTRQFTMNHVQISDKTAEGFTLTTLSPSFYLINTSISYSWNIKHITQNGGGSATTSGASGAPISFVVY